MSKSHWYVVETSLRVHFSGVISRIFNTLTNDPNPWEFVETFGRTECVTQCVDLGGRSRIMFQFWLFAEVGRQVSTVDSPCPRSESW